MTKKQVKVQSVNISKGWSDGDDKYSCTVTLTSDAGKIELKLPEERVSQIVDHVADMVIESTKEQMAQLTNAAMAHTLIEHQTDEAEDSAVG